jgi:PBP1b-binding outer membrane lipoprotein LpoB
MKKEWHALAFMFVILLFAGCTSQTNDENPKEVVDDMKNNTKKNETMNLIKIEETTVGTVGPYSVGVGNIFKDKDGIYRVTLAFFRDEPKEEKTFRVAKGDEIKIGNITVIIDSIETLMDANSLVMLKWKINGDAQKNETTNSVTIDGTTVGRIGNYKAGVSNIYKDSSTKKSSVTLSFFGGELKEEKTFRVVQGQVGNVGNLTVTIDTIEIETNGEWWVVLKWE